MNIRLSYPSNKVTLCPVLFMGTTVAQFLVKQSASTNCSQDIFRLLQRDACVERSICVAVHFDDGPFEWSDETYIM